MKNDICHWQTDFRPSEPMFVDWFRHGERICIVSGDDAKEPVKQ